MPGSMALDVPPFVLSAILFSIRSVLAACKLLTADYADDADLGGLTRLDKKSSALSASSAVWFWWSVTNDDSVRTSPRRSRRVRLKKRSRQLRHTEIRGYRAAGRVRRQFRCDINLLAAGGDSIHQDVGPVERPGRTGTALVVRGVHVHAQVHRLGAVDEHRHLGDRAHLDGPSIRRSGGCRKGHGVMRQVTGRVHYMRQGARKNRLAVLVQLRKLGGRLRKHGQGQQHDQPSHNRTIVFLHYSSPRKKRIQHSAFSPRNIFWLQAKVGVWHGCKHHTPTSPRVPRELNAEC